MARAEMDVSVLKDKILIEIKIDFNNSAILFVTEDHEQYRMYHEQDCCESVTIEDIVGDLNDLLGTPILLAESVTNSMYDVTHEPDIYQRTFNILSDPGPKNDYEESYTWTFYKFSTIKGSVTIRWYGSSNGYYSESVTFAKIQSEQ